MNILGGENMTLIHITISTGKERVCFETSYRLVGEQVIVQDMCTAGRVLFSHRSGYNHPK